MPVEILLRSQVSSMEEARIVRCLARDGDLVTEGQALFVVEHGGDVHEIEAPATGTLKVTASMDQTYEVGAVLGYIE